MEDNSQSEEPKKRNPDSVDVSDRHSKPGVEEPLPRKEEQRVLSKVAIPTRVHFIAALVINVVLATLSLFLNVPLLFAASGPTMVLLIHEPQHRASRPLSIFLGHSTSLVIALSCLFIFGLYNAPSALVQGFTIERLLAVSIALGITTAFGDNTPFYHPPAGSTALLVSLGMMKTTIDLISIILGAAILSIFSFGYKRWIRYYRKKLGLPDPLPP